MSQPKERRVAICTVTHNSLSELSGFFSALEAIETRGHHLELMLSLVDSGSTDGSQESLETRVAKLPWASSVHLASNNLGFARGMNQAIAMAGNVDWVFSLNADARLQSTTINDMIRALDRLGADATTVGAITPRILRLDEPDTLDACGMVLTRAWRHLDRGSNQPDRGQYGASGFVFGATGAAALYRHEALLDIAIEGEIFQSLFHSYREDAELAFRLQERGWSVLYTPDARVLHRRGLPSRRRDVNPFINRHSLKNRYLLRALHQTPSNFWRTFLQAALRDFSALLYVVAFERSSLGAYSWLWQNRQRILALRRIVQARRTKEPKAVDRWFQQTFVPLAGSDHDG